MLPRQASEYALSRFLEGEPISHVFGEIVDRCTMQGGQTFEAVMSSVELQYSTASACLSLSF